MLICKLKTKETVKEVRTEEHQLVVFNLGDESFGVDIAQVREIIKMVEITQMPDAPEFVEGIINLRGHIMTIMDLRKRLGMKLRETSEQTRIIIVEASDISLGMIVDSVSEVLRISSKDIDPPPSTISSYGSEYFLGVGKLPEGVLSLLDLNKLLSEKELNQIKETTDIKEVKKSDTKKGEDKKKKPSKQKKVRKKSKSSGRRSKKN